MTASAPQSLAPPHMTGALLARNTGFNLLGLGLPLLVALVAVPPLLSGLGPERFGLLGLAWLFITLVGEIGLGRAATKFVAEALGRGQPAAVGQVVRTTLTLQIALGTAVGATTAALVPWVTGSVLDLSASLAGEARTAFLLVAAALPAAMLAALLRGILEGTQRFDLVNAVRFAVSTASYLLPLVALAMGWGLPGMMVLLLASRAAAAACYGFLAARQLARMGVVRGGSAAQGPSPGALLRYGGWVTVATVLTPLLLSVDRLLLAALVSVAAVGIYTAPYELILRLVLIPASLAATLFPVFSTLQGMQGSDRLAGLLARSSRYVLGSVGPAVVLMVTGAEVFLPWWLGSAYVPDTAVALRLLGPGVLGAALAQVPFSLLQGVGRADIPGKLYLLELPLVVALAWVLVARWGVAGAAAAWSLRALVEAAALYLAAVAAAPATPAAEGRRFAATALCLLAVGILTAWVVSRAGGSALAGFVALGAAAVLLSLLLWRIALDPGERSRILRILGPRA